MSCLTATTYRQTFPTELPQKAAQSFLVTVGITLLGGAAMNVALLAGAMALSVSVIEAVTRPIIRAVFPENPFIAECFQIIVPTALVLNAALALAPMIGITYKITSIILPFIAWICLNERFYEKNIAMAQVF